MSKRPAFPAPVVITTSEAVESLCEKLRHEPFVTIDTEFVREKTYWPKLCLVQLGGEEDVAIIDACTPGISLAPLAELLAEPTCTKVFHAARQDLEIFLHLFGRLPVNIFDTQIAAMVAGFGEQVGYDSLVGSITGQSIDKTHRFSDWAARPLTPAQIAYASADVTHLRDVYRQLSDQLKAQERVHWVEAEQAILSEEKTFRPDPRRLWEKLKARTHNRRVLAILRELASWRELAAQRVDMPRQRLVRDESLLEIAAVKPRHAKALARIRGVSAEFAAGALGHELLEAIEIGEAVPEADLPAVPYKKRSERPRPAQGVVALLKVLLSARCETHRVAARLVATSDDLERLALGETELPVLHGWRRDIFGQEALSLLAGEVSLSICEGKLHVEETS